MKTDRGLRTDARTIAFSELIQDNPDIADALTTFNQSLPDGGLEILTQEEIDQRKKATHTKGMTMTLGQPSGFLEDWEISDINEVSNPLSGLKLFKSIRNLAITSGSAAVLSMFDPEKTSELFGHNNHVADYLLNISVSSFGAGLLVISKPLMEYASKNLSRIKAGLVGLLGATLLGLGVTGQATELLTLSYISNQETSLLVESPGSSTLENKFEVLPTPKKSRVFSHQLAPYEHNDASSFGYLRERIDGAITNTEEMLAPYEKQFEFQEHLDSQNYREIYNRLHERKDTIYSACQEEKFDNPDLILALYYNDLVPDEFKPYPVEEIILMWEEEDPGLAYPRNRNTEEFKEFVKQRYIRSFMDNLEQTIEIDSNDPLISQIQARLREGDYFILKDLQRFRGPQKIADHSVSEKQQANVLEALALFKYTKEEITKARLGITVEEIKLKHNSQQWFNGNYVGCVTGFDVPDDLNIDYFELINRLPNNSTKKYSPSELTFRNYQAPAIEFVPTVLRDYFLIKRAHKEVLNKYEQSLNKEISNIPEPKIETSMYHRVYIDTEPVTNGDGSIIYKDEDQLRKRIQAIVNTHGNSQLADEKIEQACDSRHKETKFQLQIGEKGNVVHPGRIYKPDFTIKSKYNTTTANPKDSLYPLIKIDELSIEAGSGPMYPLQIPIYAKTGTFELEYKTGLSDGCQLKITTDVTVSNSIHPDE